VAGITNNDQRLFSIVAHWRCAVYPDIGRLWCVAGSRNIEYSDTGSGCAARVGTAPVANEEYAAFRRRVPVAICG
jgi:hypothetical protein